MQLPNGLDIRPQWMHGGLRSKHCNEHHAATDPWRTDASVQCVPVHPLPKLGAMALAVQPHRAGKGAPGPENSGLGVGCTDLCVHRVRLKQHSIIDVVCGSMRTGVGAGGGTVPLKSKRSKSPTAEGFSVLPWALVLTKQKKCWRFLGAATPGRPPCGWVIWS